MSFRQPTGLLIKGAAVVSALALAPVSSAAPGDHIRTGNLTITPSLGLGFQVRSNAFRAATNPRAAGIAVALPAVTAELTGPDVRFNLGANYALQKYMFVTGDGETSELVKSLDRFNNIGLSSGLDILPNGQVGLSLGYNVALRNNPSDIDIDADDPYTTQFQNVVTAGLPIRPGPALAITPGFRYSFTQFFVPDGEGPREPLNARNSYGPQLELNWNFLPRTTFVASASYMLNRWTQEEPDVGGGVLQVNDSGIGRAEVGVQGRFTERLLLVAKVGSGFGSFQNSTSLGAVDGLLLALQATYSVSDDHKITGGVRKSFFDSFFTNSVSVVSLQAGWKGSYGKLSSNLDIGTRFEDYSGPVERNDQVTRLNLGLTYAVNEWAGVNLGGGWLQRSAPDAPDAEYDDVNGSLTVRFTY